MEKQNNKVEETQGAKPTRSAQPAYALQSFKKAVDRTIEAGLLNKEDAEKLKAINKKMVEQYLGYKMEI